MYWDGTERVADEFLSNIHLINELRINRLLLRVFLIFCFLLRPITPGVSNLIQQVCRLNKGLRLLNLSKTSLSSKGMSAPRTHTPYTPWFRDNQYLSCFRNCYKMLGRLPEKPE